MDTSAIKAAVSKLEGQAALADAIGAHKVVVNQWFHGQRPVPARWCIPIEQATHGAVTRYDLREDIFGKKPEVDRKSEAA